MRKSIIALLSLLAPVFMGAQEQPPLFPFLPTHNAPDNITNVATWPGVHTEAAGSQGFIAAKGDQFVDGTGQERRFFGTNICFTGCFPTHEQADAVSAELARYGFNILRLHYVHHKFPPGKVYPKEDSFIEPEQLERFDYFFAKCKEHGIYIYFQLNIARKFGAQNGFENADKLPFFNQGIDNIEPRMIRLQKIYISELLNHVNPYTGLKYKEDPAISMLELANENSIISAWFRPRNHFSSLPEPYRSDLMGTWNDWLTKKYGSTKELKKAWMAGMQGDGTELMPDGIIGSEALKDWGLQTDNGAEGSWSVEDAQPSDKLKGKQFLRVVVKKQGAIVTQPQFYRTGLKFEAMQPLCLKFKARADRVCDAKVRFSQHHAPWQTVGLQADITLGKKWKEYTFNFVAGMEDPRMRLLFSHLTPSTIDIADVSLTTGIDYKWPREQSLEAGTVEWPTPTGWSLPPQRAYDFTEFLAYMEAHYFSTMYSHAKVTVKARQPVTGTQLTYGFDQPQARTDYIDCHSYWNHPVSVGSELNYSKWSVGETPLCNGTDYPGTNLAGIAGERILGKPYTVSEYGHPSLNYYSGEGYLMAAAFGSFQNWSGIMQFAWSENDNFFRNNMNPRHEMCSSTHQMVHMPACYSMFVRGDVTPGSLDTVLVRKSTLEGDIRAVAMSQGTAAIHRKKSNLMGCLPLAIRAGETLAENPSLFKEAGRKVIVDEEDVPHHLKYAYYSKEMVSSTGEITWNWKVKDKGFFKVDTDNTKVFSGFVDGRSFPYKGLTLTPGATQRDWLTLSLTLSNPGKEKAGASLKTGHWLLAATGMCHNEDAVVVNTGGKFISSCEQNGGNPGKGPVVCEGIDADITLPGLAGRVSCYALDPDGARMQEVPVEADSEGNALLRISHDYKTVWYELIVK